MPYISHTKEDTDHMLDAIGISAIEDLFDAVPQHLLKKMEEFDLPKGLSEQETRKKMTQIARKNKNPELSFVGGGYYQHYLPSHVRHLAGRSEFYTAYTPYQPEISQGILQSIFEYQTMITRLTAMDATNASMYDGSSASGETCFMASNITGRKKILVLRSVHPEYREVMKTYCWAKGLKIEEVPFDMETGRVDFQKLKDSLTDEVAGVFVQSPNFFGTVEDIMAISELAHEKGALSIQMIAEGISLGLLKPPGEMGADIAVGDGQSFGLPISGGGPSFGFIATKEKYIRQLPGRIVGETEDSDGKKAYVLTLQAREQHIRREKASSNICSNQAWCALHAVIYLATLGKNLRKLAEINHQNALFLQRSLTKKNSWKRIFSAPFFNEFVVDVGNAKGVLSELRTRDIGGGIDLGKLYPELEGKLLVCATEIHSGEDVEKYVKGV
ncbi:aminomethyl-transferring glycine dehydrogenase subunit GcvPA [Candidatus Peregrinibacteria bacterium]|nr:aminomethyl-transferring glycine dehydrogenase subunit GcvPA [Candidatus Peregrinibacteria bacterium]